MPPPRQLVSLHTVFCSRKTLTNFELLPLPYGVPYGKNILEFPLLLQKPKLADGSNDAYPVDLAAETIANKVHGH